MIFGTQSPTWFLGFDSILETVFVLVTLLVAWYSWRTYRFTGARSYKRWSTGFLLIAAAYAVNALTNLFLYLELVENGTTLGSLGELTRIYNVGLFSHMLLFLVGYLILALVSLKVDDRRLSPLFVLLIVATAIAAIPFRPFFYLVIGVLLLYLIVTASRGEGKRNHLSRRLVLAGFILLLLGQLTYVITAWSVSYVAGHMLEFLGYAALLSSMVVIMGKR